MPVIGPLGPVPLLWHTSWKPPANQSHVSVPVNLPAGPIGDSLASPSIFHCPAKTASRLCSGPGVGFGGCAVIPAEASTSPAAMDAMTRIDPPSCYRQGFLRRHEV